MLIPAEINGHALARAALTVHPSGTRLHFELFLARTVAPGDSAHFKPGLSWAHRTAAVSAACPPLGCWAAVQGAACLAWGTQQLCALGPSHLALI